MRHNAEVSENGLACRYDAGGHTFCTFMMFHHFYSIHPDAQRTGTGMLYLIARATTSTICYDMNAYLFVCFTVVQ
jgi:hypothetical protein